MKSAFGTLLLAAVAFALSSAPAAQSGAKYTVVPVGDFNPLKSSSADDLNNANQVAGTYTHTSGESRAFLYSGGTNLDLGTLGGTFTTATSINGAGSITGLSSVQPGAPAPYHAFRYSAGTMTDLGTLPGGNMSLGIGINDSGSVVGAALTAGSAWAAVVWNGSTMTTISPAGWSNLGPSDINASNTIVGSGTAPNGGSHAFTYTAGVMTDLGKLTGDAYSSAQAVNDAGLVVGSSTNYNNVSTAVQWTNGTISALNTLPGAMASAALGVNNDGVIVGVVTLPNGGQRAVRWSGGTIVDLNTEIAAGSGWTLEDAYAINDGGAIVGNGTYNGVPRGFLMRPIADTTPPAISCGAADGMWHAANVSIACTAWDSGSGLANPADASFSLSTSVGAGSETPNASTGTRTVCDNAGNCATAGPIGGNTIDRAAPAISISSPTATTYQFLSSQIASYGCADGGSGIAACSGTVSNGAGLDTATVGLQTFTVMASDAVGNMSAATVQYSVVATNWPQFHNGPDRSGLQSRESVLNPTNVVNLKNVWASPTWSSIYASPVVAEGIVYTPSSDGHLYAFSAVSGKQLWATPIGGTYLSSSPAVANGRVFVGSDDGSVYAINAANGNVLWQFATTGPVYASPAVAGGLVYVGSWDANLYALDAVTGKLVWQQSVVYPVRGDAAVSNGVVYLANDMLYAFDAVTGKQIWVTFPWWWSGVGASLAAVSKDLVVVGADDGSVWAIDANSAAVVWSAMTTYGTGGISGTPAIDRRLRRVYVGATDGSLYAFDLDSGAQLWSIYLAGWVNSAAAANGVVYAGALGAVHAVDARTGAILWTFNSAGAGVSSPAVADGTVYLASTDTHLYAFRR